MGVDHSLPFPRYGCCIRPQNPNRCEENHSRMPRAKGGHRRNLSAAFSYPDAEAIGSGADLLNINTATEEELMTLPGINRQTAQNIVEYRRHIDGFRKVEDLALVSGVGATRLNHIRAELCVGKRGMSKNSSASSSGIDISMHDNVSRGSAGGQGRKVNINTSNVFQLMKVRFLSQHLAENIVAYRDRKGPFATFDDLLKVKGIKSEILGAIQPSLVLADDTISVTLPSVNGAVTCDVREGQGFHELPPCGKSENLLPLAPPLSRRSIRGSTMPVPLANSFRIASWNLDRCSCEKMANPGVREVVVMTILENGFGIVAIQDVTNSESLEKLVDELNCPVLANVKSWPGSRRNWKCIVSPPFSSSPSQESSCHLAFLYDADKDVQMTNSGFVWTTTSADDQRSIPLFLAEFKVCSSFDLTIANIYLEPEVENERLNESLIQPVASILAQYDKQGSTNLLLTGHFGMSPDCPAMASLASSDFCPVLSAEKFTDISPENMKGSMCSENMWLSPTLTKVHEGRPEVIRGGLTNPWIPNGKWGWGGTASSHCPVMTTFRFNDSSDDSATLQESTDTESTCATFLIGSDS